MPVIVLLPHIDCNGCVWLPISVMNMLPNQINGVFGKLIYVHESEAAQVLANRDPNCPVHGRDGFQ